MEEKLFPAWGDSRKRNLKERGQECSLWSARSRAWPEGVLAKSVQAEEHHLPLKALSGGGGAA